MQIRFVDKADFQICGYSVETSLDESSKDVAALYNDYFNNEKATLIDNVAKNRAAEYYGLMWYLEGHERYRYLLGKETVNPDDCNSRCLMGFDFILDGERQQKCRNSGFMFFLDDETKPYVNDMVLREMQLRN